MDTLPVLSGIVLLAGVPVYMHAYYRLHRIVELEQPDWLGNRGSLKFFYEGMLEAANPNGFIPMLRIVFGPRWKQLDAPEAGRYVLRIRILLPILTGTFLIIFAGAFLSGLRSPA